jgi:hypothetical protein
MIHRRHKAALAACSMALAAGLGIPQVQALPRSQGPTISANPAPSPEQIHSLIQRAIENQHRDDRALDEFERTEHSVTRKGENGEIITDLSERIVPSPAGNIKLRLSENGVAVSPEVYLHEVEFAVNALNFAIHPNDHFKEELAKFDKRRHDHAELVDTTMQAFRLTWVGRETRTDSAGTHTFLKFLLDPNPDYKPINRFAVVFQHIHAALWVDESQAQFARVEADIATDISFAAGIAGKVYHGGHVVIVQEEVSPGIWLPTLYNYNVDGRKFVSPFAIHERTEIGRFRRVGPPPEAVEIMRRELNNLSAETPAR